MSSAPSGGSKPGWLGRRLCDAPALGLPGRRKASAPATQPGASARESSIFIVRGEIAGSHDCSFVEGRARDERRRPAGTGSENRVASGHPSRGQNLLPGFVRLPWVRFPVAAVGIGFVSSRRYRLPWLRFVSAVRFVRGNREALQIAVASFRQRLRSASRTAPPVGHFKVCQIAKDREDAVACFLEPYYRASNVLVPVRPEDPSRWHGEVFLGRLP